MKGVTMIKTKQNKAFLGALSGMVDPGTGLIRRKLGCRGLDPVLDTGAGPSQTPRGPAPPGTGLLPTAESSHQSDSRGGDTPEAAPLPRCLLPSDIHFLPGSVPSTPTAHPGGPQSCASWLFLLRPGFSFHRIAQQLRG